MNVMTQQHPRFEEFLDRLFGPEGCNVREDKQGNPLWDCDATETRPRARKILADMGLSAEEIETSPLVFYEHGGTEVCS